MARTISSEALVDAFVLAGLLAVIGSILPLSILTATTPATGADTGSHLWSLYALVHHGPSTGHLRIWSPGNLAGEPVLTHYFPAPFYLMALLSLVTGTTIAFNVGTALPIFLLPLAAYFLTRRLRFDFPGPALAAVAATVFLLNDSYDVWGGNIASTLVGEFAHTYALSCLLFGVGAFVRDLNERRPPWRSSVLFALTALSHGYALLCVPVFVLAVCIFARRTTWTEAIRTTSISGISALGLAAWWLVPMTLNVSSTSPHSAVWFGQWVDPGEAFPVAMDPLLVLGALSLIPVLRNGRGAGRVAERFGKFAVLLAPAAFCVVMVWVFPRIGLVDIRAVPQVHLLVLLSAALLVSEGLRVLPTRGSTIDGCLLVAVALTAWSYSQQTKLKFYADWNYSGWATKSAYGDLLRLSDDLRGSFSDPRVLYAKMDLNVVAGTDRVLDLLPYFAGRATLESVYTQATITSPAVYAAKTWISATPECPFREFPCASAEPTGLLAKLRLLGVGDVILDAKRAEPFADAHEGIEFGQTFGPWAVVSLSDPPRLVEVLDQPPALADAGSWRAQFYDWLLRYDGSQRFLVAREALPVALRDAIATRPGLFSETERCHPEVVAEMNRLTLRTPCPGKLHLLKFSYNDALRASSGDPIFPLSPGFIGILPRAGEIDFSFGDAPLWRASAWLSLFTVLCWLAAGVRARLGGSRR